MALYLGPQTVGTRIDLRGPRLGTLHITRPDGETSSTFSVDGAVPVVFDTAGQWQWAWEDGPFGTVPVIPAAPADPGTGFSYKRQDA